MLGVRPTEPRALLIDLSVSFLAQRHEAKEGTGEYWWLSILRGFGGGKDVGAKPEKEDEITWV